jgi:hypothetical protein
VKRVGGLMLDVEVRPIAKGQLATFEVEGGFARRPAPCDGLLIETRTSTLLIPLEEAERVMAKLRKALKNGVTT